MYLNLTGDLQTAEQVAKQADLDPDEGNLMTAGGWRADCDGYLQVLAGKNSPAGGQIISMWPDPAG